MNVRRALSKIFLHTVSAHEHSRSVTGTNFHGASRNCGLTVMIEDSVTTTRHARLLSHDGEKELHLDEIVQLMLRLHML